jgi:stearoyl-CoA desaturase (Delta-9 desaturase)
MFDDAKLNKLFLMQMVGIFTLAMATVSFVAPGPYSLLLFVFHYTWFNLSNTLYYHRGMAHQAYEFKEPLGTFLLLGGLISFLGSPREFSAIHRYHHKYADIPGKDPHTPVNSRLWAYYGWFIHIDLVKVQEQFGSVDDIKGYLVRNFAESAIGKYGSFLIYSVFIYFVFGINDYMWGLALATFVSMNSAWMLIASFCHSNKGERQKRDFSKNVRFLMLPTFGESLHQNHHRCPNAANYKMNAGEIDIGFWFAKILAKTGQLNIIGPSVHIGQPEEQNQPELNGPETLL